MTRFLSELGQDIRYGFRTMAANKAFTALAVLSLALGIGANTTIYSVMESILLRSLPVADFSRVTGGPELAKPAAPGRQQGMGPRHAWGARYVLAGRQRRSCSAECSRTGRSRTLGESLSRGESRIFHALRILQRTKPYLVVHGQAMSGSAEYVTGEYFRGLAVSPAAGRLIGSEDDRPGAAPVAVISFATSRNRFGGAPNAIDSRLSSITFPSRDWRGAAGISLEWTRRRRRTSTFRCTRMCW